MRKMTPAFCLFLALLGIGYPSRLQESTENAKGMRPRNAVQTDEVVEPLTSDKISAMKWNIHSAPAGKLVLLDWPDKVEPVWENSMANPPLSARKAVQLATAKRKLLGIDDPDWEWALESATLYPIDGDSGYWFWLVKFRHDYNGLYSGPPRGLKLAVLMDGSVPNPVKIKDD